MNYKVMYRPSHQKATKSGCVRIHVLRAEYALGRPLPVCVQIHHVDGVSTNNSNANHEICENAAYHKLLHVRGKVVAAGGNPNTQALCGDCQSVKDFSAFNRMASRKANGLQSVCRVCQQARWQRRIEATA